MVEVVYSRERTAASAGRVCLNPRFFAGPVEGASKVLVLGSWPLIEAAYRSLGVPVERLDAPPPARSVEPMRLPTVPEDERAAIYIPTDWRELPWSKAGERDLTIRGLAAMFSAEPVINKAQAVAAIEAELARRAA